MPFNTEHCVLLNATEVVDDRTGRRAQ
jgi:hypothetical protein